MQSQAGSRRQFSCFWETAPRNRDWNVIVCFYSNILDLILGINGYKTCTCPDSKALNSAIFCRLRSRSNDQHNLGRVTISCSQEQSGMIFISSGVLSKHRSQQCNEGTKEGHRRCWTCGSDMQKGVLARLQTDYTRVGGGLLPPRDATKPSNSHLAFLELKRNPAI